MICMHGNSNGYSCTKCFPLLSVDGGNISNNICKHGVHSIGCSHGLGPQDPFAKGKQELFLSQLNESELKGYKRGLEKALEIFIKNGRGLFLPNNIYRDLEDQLSSIEKEGK